MNFKSEVKAAIRNLVASKLRALLAMLGIMVGTASVVALVTLGNLATQKALEQFKGLGSDLMSVNFLPASPDMSNKVSENTIIAMKSAIPDILEIAPYISMATSGSFNRETFDSINIIGSTQSLANIINISMQEGRNIMNLDGSQSFCVLGQKMASKLKDLSPIGKQMRIGTVLCTIIGIENPWTENNFFYQDVNASIIIPISAMKGIFSDVNLNSAILKIKKDADIDTIKNNITQFFNKNSPGFQLNFQSGKEILKRLATQQQIFTLLLGLIGSISLLVGGIGVMNIMLASVAERRSEIGLRLALGAQPLNVQLMFLMEAAALAVFGGGFGVLLGILSSIFIAYLAGWEYRFFFIPPLIGFSVSLIVSLFFGFYPAYVASKLNPIDALRGV